VATYLFTGSGIYADTKTADYEKPYLQLLLPFFIFSATVIVLKAQTSQKEYIRLMRNPVRG